VTLAFDRAGSGPPLVLIHGLGHHRQAWDPVLDLLTPHREVITMDLPGHGASPPLHAAGKNAVAVMADSIGDLLTSLGLDRPHVAGNSLGGVLALILAARGRAASVTGVSPAGFFNHRYQESYAKVFFEIAVASAKLLAPVIPALARRPAGRAALFGMVVARPSLMSEAQARGDIAAIARTRDAIRAVFASFDAFTDPIPDGVPVTIAWGAKDRILPPANAVVARQRLPQARFLSLPGCGHVPMTDDPELVARVLLEGSSAP
jgi:pimeloyl-ACP methyl ester carboxylesterase